MSKDTCCSGHVCTCSGCKRACKRRDITIFSEIAFAITIVVCEPALSPLSETSTDLVFSYATYSIQLCWIFVYRKGDIVMEPMNSRDVLPKNVPGVGWGGVGWVM